MPDAALAVALEDPTTRGVVAEALRMGQKDRLLLLGIARQISPPSVDGPSDTAA